METTIRHRYATKALAGVLCTAVIGYACAPIAPSLEKTRFGGDGTTLPGGIPMAGNVFQTQLSSVDPSQPSGNRITLDDAAVQYFRAHGQVQVLLGGLPAGGVRGIYVVGLPPTAISSLQDFKTEMFETSQGSGLWVLRVKSGVHPSISQMVRDHLLRIHLELGVSGQAEAQGGGDITSDDEGASSDDTGTGTEPESEPETAEPETGDPAIPGES